jgi:hypothetical protein
MLEMEWVVCKTPSGDAVLCLKQGEKLRIYGGFDPNQPRNEVGEWSGEGGAGPATGGAGGGSDREIARTRMMHKSSEIYNHMFVKQASVIKSVEEAIVTYTSGASNKAVSYKTINAHLRNGGSFDDMFPSLPSVGRQMKALQEATKQAIHPPVIVYRAVDAKIAQKFGVDKDIVMKGFVSTSMSPEIASHFTEMKGRTLLEIKAKSGLAVSKLKETDWFGELEVLQAHGTKYRYVGKKKAKIGERGDQSLPVIMLEEV